MRDDPFYRCVGIIERFPNVPTFVTDVGQEANTDVVYSDEPAVLDDLDFVDKVKVDYDRVDLEGYEYHCGTLWARRHQDLRIFWHTMRHYFGSEFNRRVPLVFCENTLPNPLYDD